MLFAPKRQSLVTNMDIYAQPTCEGEDNCEDVYFLRRVLRTGIDHCLTPRQRTVVRLYYYENMTMPQIAAELSVNTSTVSRHLKAARIRLKHFAHQMELFTTLKQS